MRIRVKSILGQVFRHENFILLLVLLGVIGGIAGATGGKSLALLNVRNVIAQSSMRGVAAVGQAFVILSGGIDLSVGGIALFAVVLGGGLMTTGPMGYLASPLSAQLGVFIMIIAATGWGMLNGGLVSRASIPPLIVTLAMWQIAEGAAFRVSQGRTIGYMPEALSFFGSRQVLGVPIPTIIFIVVCIIGYLVLSYTTFGRSVYAVGGNPISAWLSGINVKRVRFWVYVISAALGGLAGVIVTARAMAASMLVLGGLEIDAITAVTIGGVSLMGGRGNLLGVVIGVVMIGVINNGMGILGAGPDIQGILKGVILISAVAIDYSRRR